MERLSSLTTHRTTILQIIPELDTGGAELSALEIAEAVVEAGGRALVLSEGGRLAPKLATFGAEFVPFPARTKNPGRLLWNARTIARIVEAEGVDLLHARSRAPAWSAFRAARRTGKPFVTTYHGAYAEKSKLKSLYNGVMARGDVVIANSRYTADLVKSRYGTPEDRIRVIHRGVDGAQFDVTAVSEKRKSALARAWHLKPGDRVILHAARLTGWKGQRVVIDAARRLLGEGALGNTVFVLAGDAQGREGYRAELEQLIAIGGLEDRIRLVGHVEDMPAAFALAHVAVVASTEPEAFGRAATESQVMGCPVIATAIGAPPETVLWDATKGGTTGWLVPPSNAEALAAALRSALTLSPDSRSQMGQRARTHVLERFSLEAMRQATLEVYDSLLGTQLAQNRRQAPAR